MIRLAIVIIVDTMALLSIPRIIQNIEQWLNTPAAEKILKLPGIDIFVEEIEE